jgi:hypothetical protein
VSFDWAHEIRVMHGKIKAIDPYVKIPDGETWQSYEAVRDLLYKLEHPEPEPVTAKDRQWIDANKLQNQISVTLTDYVKKGIVTYEDFPFPDEGAGRIAKLQAMHARLGQAKEEFQMSPDARAKRTQREFREFRAEVRARLHAIEQELART